MSRRRRLIGALALAALGVAPGVSRADAPKMELISVYVGTETFPNGASQRPQLSDDGRFVVFESNLPLVKEDTDKARDVYLYDRERRRTELIRADDLTRSNAMPSLSGNGRYVAFASYPASDDLYHRYADVVVYNRRTKALFMLPVGAHGETQNGESLFPLMNDDGGRILFTSNATNLVLDKEVAWRGVYLYSKFRSSLDLVSRAEDGPPANRMCANARMSEDGRWISFLSNSTNLADGLPVQSLAFHIYLIDRWSNVPIRVTTFERGFDDKVWAPGAFDMDQNGNFIVFEARKRDKEHPMRSILSYDLFLYDREGNQIKLLTTGLFAGHARHPVINHDGRFIAFSFTGSDKDGDLGGLVVYDRPNNAWHRIATGPCDNPAISADGRFIAYDSETNPDGTPAPNRSVFLIENPFAAEPTPTPVPTPTPSAAPSAPSVGLSTPTATSSATPAPVAIPAPAATAAPTATPTPAPKKSEEPSAVGEEGEK